ncbi:MAG TPA: Spy/CpxP family protein refolding chaperone [Gallionella sp.]|nr:Spy/CpxP family protein refolding chaperone [Gallionella sp.]
MNMNKIAFFSASCLIIGIATLSVPSFAADSATKKTAASQPVAKPDTHDMTSHDMMVQGEEQKGGGGCCGKMDGMMCDHKGGMMGGMEGGHMGGKMCCDQKDGKMCDHKGGMMGNQMSGKMCDHKGGMMGGHGSGMMMESPHMGMIMSLDLSDEQRAKINKLSDELKHNNWTTKGLIMDESAKLRDLYAADRRDPSAIGKEYQKIFDLQRQMIEATITSQNRIEDLLTPDQRTQLKNMRHGGAPAHDSMHEHPMHDHPMH